MNFVCVRTIEIRMKIEGSFEARKNCSQIRRLCNIDRNFLYIITENYVDFIYLDTWTYMLIPWVVSQRISHVVYA